MSGLDKLQLWLNNTEIFQCDFRPVPLKEYELNRKVLIDNAEKLELKSMYENDRDGCGLLCATYLAKNKSVLVFCSTKNNCEVEAWNLTKWLPNGFK